MRVAYEQACANTVGVFSIVEVGEKLGWDRTLAWDASYKLHAKGFLDPDFLPTAGAGNTGFSGTGRAFCEEHFGTPPGTDDRRLIFIRAVYAELSSRGSFTVDYGQIGVSLDWQQEECDRLYQYWEDRGALTTWGGRNVRYTPTGEEIVETVLFSTPPPLSETNASQTPPVGDQLLPDTEERRYAFLSVDVCGHSELVKTHSASEIRYALDGFHELVRMEAERRLVRSTSWAGDGGLALFHGEGCQRRAVETASAVLAALVGFNQHVNGLSEPIRVRIAVHTGFFVLPEDIANLHDESVNLVCKLQKDGTFPNSVSITEAVFRVLPSELQSQFVRGDEPFESTAVYSYNSQVTL